MKKKMMKSTLAVALIAAAAFGGVKTYGAYSTSTESNLLAENIEALSDPTEPNEKIKYRHQPEECSISVSGEVDVTIAGLHLGSGKAGGKIELSGAYSCPEDKEGEYSDCTPVECRDILKDFYGAINN